MHSLVTLYKNGGWVNAQWVKCWVSMKTEFRSPASKQMPTMTAHAYNLIRRQVKTRFQRSAGGHSTNQAVCLNRWIPSPERPCLKKSNGDQSRKTPDIDLWLHTLTHLYTWTLPKHIHISTKKFAFIISILELTIFCFSWVV